jgi:hypothetical protein
VLHNLVKEASEDLNPIARAYLRQARMVGKWLVQVIVE